MQKIHGFGKKVSTYLPESFDKPIETFVCLCGEIFDSNAKLIQHVVTYG